MYTASSPGVARVSKKQTSASIHLQNTKNENKDYDDENYAEDDFEQNNDEDSPLK